MLVFRFLHAAESERLAGDATRAVIDLNTAVEILVAVTLYVGGSIMGVPEKDAECANGAGVRNQVRTHLAAMLGKEIDINDPNTAWGRWFGDGYMLRNQAVHEGASLDRDAVERAFAQASEVFIEVQESLEAIEPLKRLGQVLEMDMHRSRPSPNNEPLGIGFPWE